MIICILTSTFVFKNTKIEVLRLHFSVGEIIELKPNHDNIKKVCEQC